MTNFCLNETSVLSEVKFGNNKAKNKLLKEIQKFIWNLLKNNTLPIEEKEDIVQEILIDSIYLIRRFDISKKILFTTYLARTANWIIYKHTFEHQNKIKYYTHYYNKAKSIPTPKYEVVNLDDYPELQNDKDFSDDVISKLDTEQVLNQLFSELNDIERFVVNLSLDGETLYSISDYLNISIGKVRWILNKIQKIVLKKELLKK